MGLLDTRTVFLFQGILSIMISLALWGTLKRRNITGLLSWCSAVFVIGIGTILFSLRGLIPDVLSFTIANFSIYTSIVLRTQSIRLIVGKPEPVYRIVLGILIFTGLFEYLRLVIGGDLLRFSFALLVFTLMSLRLAWWAWRLGRQEHLRGAQWIEWAAVLIAITYILSLISVATGITESSILTKDLNAFVFGTAGIFSLVFSNIGYLGIALEQSIRNQITAATAQARAEENQRLSEQIAQLDRQRNLGILSASLSHELNQPLTAILTNTQVAGRGLRLGRFDKIQLLELIERIESNTQRASQIIERIRNFIRPAGTHNGLIELEKLAHDVAALVASEARARRVRFNFAPAPMLLYVRGDPVQLSQIILNLYRNAMDALVESTEPEIHIRLEEQNGRVLLSVRDNGAGLTAAALAHAGEAFFTTKDNGLGMGLSISRHIAEQHDGRLHLTNAEEGGALAILDLPAKSMS